jgi:hydroxymethylbilane synthase
MRKIIVGSRQSKLALTQTNWVINRLKSFGLPYEFEIKKIVTKGDRILDVTLSKVGGKGLFVKEIEQALIDKEIDIAVHSMKDMPAVLQDGLMIGAIPKRVDARDVLISRNGLTLEQLPEGAVVGTSSLRREAQLRAFRNDFKIEPLRGNIDTRLRRVQDGEFDAIILAAAGLLRMDWKGEITQYLPVNLSLPAVGQGALGIECRADDAEVRALLANIHDPDTELAVTAERAFLRTLEGGCQVPIGAHALVSDDKQVKLMGLVADPKGDRILKNELSGSNPEQVGQSLAEELKAKGAAEILKEFQEANGQ